MILHSLPVSTSATTPTTLDGTVPDPGDGLSRVGFQVACTGPDLCPLG